MYKQLTPATVPSSAYHMVGRALINHEIDSLVQRVCEFSPESSLHFNDTLWPANQVPVTTLQPMREPHHKWLSTVLETNHSPPERSYRFSL